MICQCAFNINDCLAVELFIQAFNNAFDNKTLPVLDNESRIYDSGKIIDDSGLVGICVSYDIDRFGNISFNIDDTKLPLTLTKKLIPYVDIFELNYIIKDYNIIALYIDLEYA